MKAATALIIAVFAFGPNPPSRVQGPPSEVPPKDGSGQRCGQRRTDPERVFRLITATYTKRSVCYRRGNTLSLGTKPSRSQLLEF